MKGLHMWSVVLLGLICCGSVYSDDEADARMAQEYADKFRRAAVMANISDDTVFESSLGHGIDYSCSIDAPEPQSVHELSPLHINIVGAMGDSVTAAFGAKANTIIGDVLEYRGVSWSIGGEADLSSVTTIPNIVQHFNEDVKGFSTGTCVLGGLGCQNRLNVAVSGAKSKGMLSQAENLVEKINKEYVIADWKMVTLWIGGNDLCAIRKGDTATPLERAEVYRDDIKAALDYLHENSQRMFVNIVGMIDVAHLKAVKGLICRGVHMIACPPILDESLLSVVTETAGLYNELLAELIASGRYDTRDDFTVVFQPFFTDTDVPLKDKDEADKSYFAPDCFHFSQKGHEVGAVYLWNNLFEPIGEKTTHVDWEKELTLTCPENRYLATAKNSQSFGGEYNANSNNPNHSQKHPTNLAAVIVGTGVGVAVVALAIAGIAFGVVRRRRSNRFRGPTEKVQLLSFKS